MPIYREPPEVFPKPFWRHDEAETRWVAMDLLHCMTQGHRETLQGGPYLD